MSVDWTPVWGEARRNRVLLPGYAFQRKEYFIAPGLATATETALPMRQDDIGTWGWKTHWQPTAAACDVDVDGVLSEAPLQSWRVFEDEAAGPGAAAVARVRYLCPHERRLHPRPRTRARGV